jgi:hypothetical protein
MVNHSQGLVLGFFGAALIGFVVILVVAPEIYLDTLKLPRQGSLALEVAFLTTIAVFIGVLAVGVLRRWRWTLWLILIALLAGILRVPAALLELAGALPATDPTWYVIVQGLVGLIQFVIGLALIRGYRRSGIWGPF